jgi:RimJ/RimL family protein N-acetyltransferase
MTDTAIRIEGARIALRDIQAKDLEVLAYWLQPEQRWQELDGPYYDQPSPDEVARLISERRELIASDHRPVPRTNLSIAAIDTDVILGQVTCGIDRDNPSESGLNIVIFNPDLWGYGLGYEALGLWVDYLFDALPDVTQLAFRTWSGNKGMIRLAHKLGFNEVARYRKSQVVVGRRFDGLGYALGRAEWRRHFPDGFASTLIGEE